ncbi:hypothetical protein [Patiriisocius marinus]|uniref:hypothetical protein n=1 Tax=Patiriisocius marinus TaxID=1397112 RepID=UPI00232ACDCE|nr:hypothetical protein [Patiriisocius marinus]
MKGKIRLDARQSSKNANGFPVIFYITSPNEDKKEKLIATGYRAEKKNWDAVNALPKKSHPQYYELLDYLLVKKIAFNKLLHESKMRFVGYKEFENKLLHKSTGVFYSDVMSMYDCGLLRRQISTAIKSFNRYFPDAVYEVIDIGVAQGYVRYLQNTLVNGKTRSPNGINSYLDALTGVWNKLGKKNSPFVGAKVVSRPTGSKWLPDGDLIKISANAYPKNIRNAPGGLHNYLNYFMFAFYIGGCDFEVLRRLRYDEHVRGERMEFNREKGGSNVFVSNYIFPEARKIMEKYDCYPYVFPLYQFNYEAFLPNVAREYGRIMQDLDLMGKPYSKSPRYTFINRARELLIDERICKEIVGHSNGGTHSIYKSHFGYSTRDKAHRRIIDFINYPV